MLLFGLLLASLPFDFAILRIVTTGNDFRYLWVALAAAAAAGAGWALTHRGARGVATSVVTALVASAVSAAGVGFGVGAQSVPAVMFVAVGFAMCEAIGLALIFRPRS